VLKLEEHNRIQLIWVPIDGNEMDGQRATQGSSHPLIGPEPAQGIFAKGATEVIRVRRKDI